MKEVLDAAQELGWSADRLDREYFSAAMADQTGAPFKVVLAKTRCEFIVGDDEILVTRASEWVAIFPFMRTGRMWNLPGHGTGRRTRSPGPISL
jgi:hypothetical protein